MRFLIWLRDMPMGTFLVLMVMTLGSMFYIIDLIERQTPVKLFVIVTKSESSDSYHYVVKHQQKPTDAELKAFMSRKSCDRDSTEGVIYEHIQNVIEVSEEMATAIPDVSNVELENWKYCGD